MDGLHDTDITIAELIPAGAAVALAMVVICVLGAGAHNAALNIAAFFAAG